MRGASVPQVLLAFVLRMQAAVWTGGLTPEPWSPSAFQVCIYLCGGSEQVAVGQRSCGLGRTGALSSVLTDQGHLGQTDGQPLLSL